MFTKEALSPSAPVQYAMNVTAFQRPMRASQKYTAPAILDLMHKKSVVRSGNRGEGVKGEQNMKKICVNCHGLSHVKSQRDMLDNSVGLYNKYWDGAIKMIEKKPKSC